MIIGVPPSSVKVVSSRGLTSRQFIILAEEAMGALGWTVEYITEDEIAAFTNSSLDLPYEEFTVTVKGRKVEIKSESVDKLIVWSQNSKNIRQFLIHFDEAFHLLGDEEINFRVAAQFPPVAEKYLQEESEEDQEEMELPASLNRPETITDYLVPGENYLITPLLVYFQLIIFISMVLFAGVDVLKPSSEALTAWGGNLKTLTLNGEWWRIFTSIFLHLGLVHLLLNTFVLLVIGALLEPLIGRWPFLLAYVLAGVAGSVAGLWENELYVGIGASSAIFGLYGVFIALLITGNSRLKESGIIFLFSTLAFILYNLAYDIEEGVNNAAHAGGLLSGIAIGFLLYPSLKNHEYSSIRTTNLGLILLLFCGIFYFSFGRIPDGIARYATTMSLFHANEKRALAVLENRGKLHKAEFRRQLRSESTKLWNENMELIDGLDRLPEPYATRAADLRKYCELRKKECRLIITSINEQTDEYEDEIEELREQIEELQSEIQREKGYQL